MRGVCSCPFFSIFEYFSPGYQPGLKIVEGLTRPNDVLNWDFIKCRAAYEPGLKIFFNPGSYLNVIFAITTNINSPIVI